MMKLHPKIRGARLIAVSALLMTAACAVTPETTHSAMIGAGAGAAAGAIAGAGVGAAIGAAIGAVLGATNSAPAPPS
jgi:hypothetical protein